MPGATALGFGHVTSGVPPAFLVRHVSWKWLLRNIIFGTSVFMSVWPGWFGQISGYLIDRAENVQHSERVTLLELTTMLVVPKPRRGSLRESMAVLVST